jgi:WD40 repeat protein
VTALVITPDGLTLLSGDAAGEVRRWDLRALAPERHRWALPGTGYSAAMSHDGRWLASAGWGGWIAVLDQESGRVRTRWDGHGTSGVAAAWAPGDVLLATTGNDNIMKVWDTRSEPPTLVFERPIDVQSLGVAFSSDGRYVASPAGAPSLKVWSVPEGREVASLEDSAAFSDVAWHPTRPLLAAAGDDGVVRLWDVGARRFTGRLEEHGTGDAQVTFSRDGARLAAASRSGRVRVWDVGSRRLLSEMSVTNGGQSSVAFSPDGRRLATCGSDNNVHVWDPATGAHLLKLPFSETPWDLTWSPDGRRLMVVVLDGSITVFAGGAAGGGEVEAGPPR